MSLATSTGDHASRADPGRQRFKFLKPGLALLSVLILLYCGFRGRNQAVVRGKIDQITSLRDQLLLKLDSEQQKPGYLFGEIRGTNRYANWPEFLHVDLPVLNALNNRLQQFESQFAASRLSPDENLDFRLSKAVSANAGKNFQLALTLLKPEDEHNYSAATDPQSNRLARVLQVRGDALYGLAQFQEALDAYQHAAKLQSNGLVLFARMADSQYALGRTNDAHATSAGLAKRQVARGDTLLAGGKTDAAPAHYDAALEILTRLTQGETLSDALRDLAQAYNRRGALYLLQGVPDAAIRSCESAVKIGEKFAAGNPAGAAAELAASYASLANATLAAGKPLLAIPNYEKSIEIQSRLVKGGAGELESALSKNHNNLGNCLLAQQKLDAATSEYDRAIETQTRLLKLGPGPEIATELALSYNNRGVILRAQKGLEAALPDFDSAVNVLSSVLRPETSTNILRARSPVPEVKTDVPVGYSDKSLEFQPRTHLASRPDRAAIVRAVSLKNRGYIQLLRGNPKPALPDFIEAAAIYSRLFDGGNEKDLALSFARSLTPLAWIYATSPDDSIRNGRKAKDYATKACELTDWKSFPPLEALAAACALNQEFADATKWQEMAVQFTPPRQKTEARARLELYKTGKPYRSEK